MKEECTTAVSFQKGLVDNPRTSHLLPPTRNSTHGRNLRNANKFILPTQDQDQQI